MERALVGDSRKDKFKDSEGDDEAMVDHHEKLGEKSSWKSWWVTMKVLLIYVNFFMFKL